MGESCGEVLCEPSVKHLHASKQQVVRSLASPSHLLSFREPAVDDVVHHRFSRGRRYASAADSGALIVNKIPQVVL